MIREAGGWELGTNLRSPDLQQQPPRTGPLQLDAGRVILGCRVDAAAFARLTSPEALESCRKAARPGTSGQPEFEIEIEGEAQPWRLADYSVVLE
jgi:hypothetical protein